MTPVVVASLPGVCLSVSFIFFLFCVCVFLLFLVLEVWAVR